MTPHGPEVDNINDTGISMDILTITTPVFGCRSAGASRTTICLLSPELIRIELCSYIRRGYMYYPRKNGRHTVEFEWKRRVDRGETPVFGHFSARLVTISHGCRAMPL